MRYLALVLTLLTLFVLGCQSTPPANTDFLNNRDYCDWQADQQDLEGYNRAIYVRACTGQPNPAY